MLHCLYEYKCASRHLKCLKKKTSIQTEHAKRLKPELNPFSMIPSTAQNCSGLRTCVECLERAECGWCGDPTNTGKGVCVEGSYRGPMKTAAARAGQRVGDKDMLLDQSLCSSDRGYNWAFIQCPGKRLLFRTIH